MSTAPINPSRERVGIRRQEQGSSLVLSRRRVWILLITLVLGTSPWLSPALVNGQDLNEVRQLYRTGEYTRAARLAQTARESGERSIDWPILQAEALLAIGQHDDALTVLTNSVAENRLNLRAQWLAHEVQRQTGRSTDAAVTLRSIQSLIRTRAWAYRDPPDLVALGRAAIHLGVDPKEVLERIFEAATRLDPEYPESYLARGTLALDKQDAALASRVFGEAIERFPEDPDMHHGLARAFENSDRSRMGTAIEAALDINPRHVPTLLLLVDHRLQLEDFEGATKLLEEIDEVHPKHPEAWAYRAVIAHLRYDLEGERAARETALSNWAKNPLVDHRIGQKLSQKYRFTEGATYQRRALAMDSGYIPAKAQLASDLLRLGDAAGGWKLAREVHDADGYDVAAYNLVTLEETMGRYVTRTNAHFVLRMEAREDALYGARVLALLDKALAVLSEKYGLYPAFPTTVEIFSQQKDFGVRTFGMPENPGYLGVCFGQVITANSPATRPGQQVNWEAVLWHEFCHVITLQATRNRTPRWLSEGISVYEEFQENPAWGQDLSPRYREMILQGEFVPIARLSAAFLTPKSDLHLQLAYFQSALVVEHIIDNHGLSALLDVLNALRDGMVIHEALDRHVAPLDDLEKSFAEFAKNRALAVGPGLDWKRPPSDLIEPGKTDALTQWSASNATNYWALRHMAQAKMEEKALDEAIVLLKQLIELYPEQQGAESARPLLASIYRAREDFEAEEEILEQHALRTADAQITFQRLMDLAALRGDWWQVRRNANRLLAVNPLVAIPYRQLAEAEERLGHLPEAIAAHRAILHLDPANPADARYQLARLLHTSGGSDARRHLVEALSDAPRMRPALKLLLEMHRASNPTTDDSDATTDDPSSPPVSTPRVLPTNTPANP